MAKLEQITIYGDGACSGNPGPGGWAFILITPRGQVVEKAGYQAETTNNRMELTAIGKALREIETIQGDVQIFTDSRYVIDGITKWLPGWKSRQWKKADGKEVLNILFWKRLHELVEARSEAGSQISWTYVPGHSGNPGNDRCDELAQAFSKGKRPSLYHGSLKDYPIKII